LQQRQRSRHAHLTSLQLSIGCSLSLAQLSSWVRSFAFLDLVLGRRRRRIVDASAAGVVVAALRFGGTNDGIG
jgi:hypothetical protein